MEEEYTVTLIGPSGATDVPAKNVEQATEKAEHLLKGASEYHEVKIQEQ